MDREAHTLAKAMALTESGPDKPNYNAVGDGGRSRGAWQWSKDTWRNHAQQILNNADADPTPENQNRVAYGMIKKWKDAGYRAEQIASMWNAGEGRPDAYKNWRGVNAQGIRYDTPAYVKKVKANYDKLMGGYQVPVPQKEQKTLEVQPQRQKFADKDLLGKATRIADYASLGIGDKMGESIGALGGYLYTLAKDKIKGTDTAKYYDLSAPKPTEVAGEAGQALLLAGTPYMKVAQGGLLTKSALTGGASGLFSSLASGDTKLEDIGKDTLAGATIGIILGGATKITNIGEKAMASATWNAADKAQQLKELILKNPKSTNALHTVANIMLEWYKFKPQLAMPIITELSRTVPEFEELWQWQLHSLGPK